ncbi:MAG: ABC transporter substrate-binding protein [bacterium]|nr:MAG: ABC transporter substrate-binding protein [bacterium]
MKGKLFNILVTVFVMGFMCQVATAGEIVVNCDGGTNLETFKKTMFKPFEKATGHKIIYDPGANFAKLRAMVKSGNVEWDLAEAWSQDLVIKLGREGVLEEIDYSVVGSGLYGVNKEDLYTAVVTKWGVGDGFYSTVIGYNTEKFPAGKEPKSWKDFWNVEKFPGPRALQKGPWGNLEFALLADGVPLEKLYPLDVERALKSMDKIKKHVKVWWESGAQPVQLLNDREVDMTSIWNGRIYMMIKDGAKVGIQWNQAFLMASAWVVPKGAKNKKLAMELIQWCMKPEPQARHAEIIGYPGINKKLYDYMDKKYAVILPTYPANYEVAVLPNYDWWIENRDKVTEQWNAWILK